MNKDYGKKLKRLKRLKRRMVNSDASDDDVADIEKNISKMKRKLKR